MASYNKVMLIGNLTRDPEVRYTPKGSAVCDIGLAVNRVYTSDSGEKVEEVTFVDVVLWSKMAELAGKYLHKGRPVFIEGRLQMDSWEDKATGQKRTRCASWVSRCSFSAAHKVATVRPLAAATTKPAAILEAAVVVGTIARSSALPCGLPVRPSVPRSARPPHKTTISVTAPSRMAWPTMTSRFDRQYSGRPFDSSLRHSAEDAGRPAFLLPSRPARSRLVANHA
jgi:primosomal replication protein N